MKKLIVFLVLCLCAGIIAQEEELELYEPHQNSIGSLVFGWTRYFNLVNSYAKPSGFSFGVLLPVNVPLDTHVKIKGTYFNVQENTEDNSASLVNELLIGKIAYREDYLFVLPQLGFGMRYESLLYRINDRYFNVKLFLDASVWFDYHLETFSAGLMVNFEQDLPSEDPGLISDSRFNVSFTLTK